MFLQEGEELALGDGLDHAAAVHLLDDEGNREHGVRPDLAHCVYQYGRGREFLNVPHSRSAGERIEHAYAHLVGVCHRQH